MGVAAVLELVDSSMDLADTVVELRAAEDLLVACQRMVNRREGASCDATNLSDDDVLWQVARMSVQIFQRGSQCHRDHERDICRRTSQASHALQRACQWKAMMALCGV